MLKNVFTSLAVLFAVTLTNAQVVITEIMYNPPETGTDSLEYFEVYNSGSAAVDMTGWTTFGVTFTFPAFSINPGQYITLAVNAAAYQNNYGAPADFIWTGGALNNSGELLQILDATGTLVDEVNFDDVAPWPVEPDDGGPSLELCSVTANNDDPINWKPSVHSLGFALNGKTVYGTPKASNSVNCIPTGDHTVTVMDFSFTPKDITITEGESVLWVNTGGTHNINGDQSVYPGNPESFGNGPAAPATWYYVHTFNIPGLYNYRCDPHASQGMTGTVTVLDHQVPDVVITEVMYNNPGVDSLEFMELYNNTPSAVDMSGWTVNFAINHVFAPGTTLAPGGYLVLAQNATLFNSLFGTSAIQWDGGTFNNTGEKIELRDNLGFVADSVIYSSTAPWPIAANGNGPSIVLCDYNSNNALGSNWAPASTPTGVIYSGGEVFANPGAASDCSAAIQAFNDGAQVQSGGSVTVNVLSNDVLPNPGVIVNVATQGIFGVATVNPDNTITYAANPGACGDDFVTYSVTDGISTATATLMVHIICFPSYTIAQVTGENATSGVADSVGVTCSLTATVYGFNWRPNGMSFWLIDDTNNGINLFRATGNAGYTVQQGDKITVRGLIGQFNGLIQMTVDTAIKISSNNQLVNPLVVQKPDESTESKLIRINNLTLTDPAQWTTGVGTGGFTVTATNPAGDIITIRIDNDCEAFNAPAPLPNFHLTGIGSQFDNSNPFTDGYQISPRFNSDIEVFVDAEEPGFASQVRVWPTPATDVLNIYTETAFDQIVISNAQGQQIRTIQAPSSYEKVSMESLSTGMYFVRFEKDGAFWTTKIVKM